MLAGDVLAGHVMHTVYAFISDSCPYSISGIGNLLFPWRLGLSTRKKDKASSLYWAFNKVNVKLF